MLKFQHTADNSHNTLELIWQWITNRHTVAVAVDTHLSINMLYVYDTDPVYPVLWYLYRVAECMSYMAGHLPALHQVQKTWVPVMAVSLTHACNMYLHWCNKQTMALRWPFSSDVVPLFDHVPRTRSVLEPRDVLTKYLGVFIWFNSPKRWRIVSQ